MKTALKYIIPLLITVGLCRLLFTQVDFREMWHIVTTQCDFRWIAFGLFLSLFSYLFRALRWQIQLRALGIRPSLFILVLSIFGTYAVNLVLPRLGELWRTGWIAARQKAPFATVFGSMICDRLADTVTVFLLTLVAFILARTTIISYLTHDPALRDRITDILTSPWLWTAIVVAAIAILMAFRLFPHAKPIVAARKLCRGVWEGFAVVSRMKGKGLWLFYTLLLWTCYFTQLYVAFFAFPATARVVADYGIIAVLVCWVLSSLAMVVPSNGGIGPYQWALVFGLGIYSAGIPELTTEMSVTFANLVMGANTLLIILLGLFTFIYTAVTRPRTA